MVTLTIQMAELFEENHVIDHYIIYNPMIFTSYGSYCNKNIFCKKCLYIYKLTLIIKVPTYCG